MIARDNRFHGHNAVSRVRGSAVHSELLSIRAAANKRRDYRLAVVVSKKVDNRAVVRNRIRRRVFEAVRTQKLLDGVPIDVVVYVKSPKVADVPSEVLHEQIAELTKKVLKH